MRGEFLRRFNAPHRNRHGSFISGHLEEACERILGGDTKPATGFVVTDGAADVTQKRLRLDVLGAGRRRQGLATSHQR